jgi:DNA (cytosine-5)-methyltransferase 1
VFVVGYLGDWRRAAAVLFERDSLSGNPAPSREARQEVTEVAGTLTANGGGLTRPAGNANELDFCVTTFDRQSTGEYGTQPVASTIAARDYKSPSDLVSYGIPGNWIGRKPENGGNAVEPMHDVAPCLTKADQHAVAHPMIVHGTQDPCTSDIAFAQGRNNGGENVLVQPQAYLFMGESVYRPMAVRRLTPRECERLQGFQDDYTNIPGASDSARYKALGTSMAVPVMRWIGERIAMVDAIADVKAVA